MSAASAIRRVPFIVLPLAHDQFRCTRCRARMARGDRAVALHQPGVSVEFQHDGKCPPLVRSIPRA